MYNGYVQEMETSQKIINISEAIKEILETQPKNEFWNNRLLELQRKGLEHEIQVKVFDTVRGKSIKSE